MVERTDKSGSVFPRSYGRIIADFSIAAYSDIVQSESIENRIIWTAIEAYRYSPEGGIPAPFRLGADVRRANSVYGCYFKLCVSEPIARENTLILYARNAEGDESGKMVVVDEVISV